MAMQKNVKMKKEGRCWHLPRHGVYHLKKLGKIRMFFDCRNQYVGIHLVRTQVVGEGGHPKWVQLRTRGGGVMQYVCVRTCAISFHNFGRLNISISCIIHRQKMHRYNIYLSKRCPSGIYISSYTRCLLAVNLPLSFELIF